MLILSVLFDSQEPLLQFPHRDMAALVWQGREVLNMRSVVGRPDLSTERRPAEPLYLGYPHGPKDAQFVPEGLQRTTYRLRVDRLAGTLNASQDAFACTIAADAPVGSIFGRPFIPAANSVYDRSGDWLISFEATDLEIRPTARGAYTIRCDSPCTIVFRPDYYRDHLGYFLWDKTRKVRERPVAGWCSWMAHLQKVNEADVVAAAKFFSANLKDYGYDAIQIDDGFQRVKQFGEEEVAGEPYSALWTKPNDKFPNGMDGLARAIKAAGMTPGVWIGYYVPLGLKNSSGYITDPDGRPHKGPWVNYAMNGLDVAARDEAYLDTVREFKRQGWDYFKIDTLRHVLYDSYRQTPQYWLSRGERMEDAFRTLLSETKKAVGDSYMLACWGVMPELAGLADGARIGEDVGPDFESMRRTAKYVAQFQYLNNVVWSNDPDYMCLRVPIAEARAWATLCFLAGGHVMVSDPVSTYDSEKLDALRRVGPPIQTRPLNAVSLAPDPEYMMLAAERGGEEWLVVSRFAWRDLEAASPDLKLPKGSYLAFDFWDEKFLGTVRAPTFRSLEKGTCQVISLRKDLGRPQVLGTNRHLSQGAYELEKLRWAGDRLSGRFQRGPGQPWSIYLRVPRGWQTATVLPDEAQAELDGEVMKLTFPVGRGPVDWSVSFKRFG